MKAVVDKKYGPPEALKLEEVSKPIPSDDEVLVEVHAPSVDYSEAKSGISSIGTARTFLKEGT
jgi:NADPH:quinone reductase-like Zn-dependent oxidoreductase